MQHKIYPIIITLLTILIQNLQAQDFSYSQYMLNPALINPAQTGAQHGTLIGIHHRNQWTGVPDGFTNTTININQSFPAWRMGLGLIANQSKEGAGSLTYTNICTGIGYYAPFNDYIAIVGGLRGGWHHQSIDWSQLEFSDQFNPVQGNVGNSQAITPDALNRSSYFVDGGLLLSGEIPKSGSQYPVFTFQIGGSVKYLASPNVSFIGGEQSTLPLQITAHAHINVPVVIDNDYYLNFEPHIRINKQANLTSFNYGVLLKRYNFQIGTFYENRTPLFYETINTNAYIFLASYDFYSKSIDTDYEIQLSYEFNGGGLGTRTIGTVEASIAILFNSGIGILGGNKPPSERNMGCPGGSNTYNVYRQNQNDKVKARRDKEERKRKNKGL